MPQERLLRLMEGRPVHLGQECTQSCMVVVEVVGE